VNRFKITVYAICKDEEQFVDRWMDSMQEADQVVVLDTGSADGTVARLRERGALVEQQIISPWRFDLARNRSLELVPDDTDICVCTDLDEVLQPGWRQRLEEAWVPGTCRASYRYTWSFLPDGGEGVVFWTDKVHANHKFRWIHPVHEVLEYLEGGSCPMVTVEGMQLDHHPDPSKSRAQYLPLLELAVAERPEDDRNMHYLGREYLFKGRWDDCIQTLKRHLLMPNAQWRDERCASMRYIARAYAQKGEREEAKSWFYRAIAQAPYLREPYMDLAFLLYEEEEWDGVLFLVKETLKITERPRTYICEAAPWGSAPYDLASLACFYTGRYRQSLEWSEQAVRLAPDDQRLLKNRELIRQAAEH